MSRHFYASFSFGLRRRKYMYVKKMIMNEGKRSYLCYLTGL